MKTSSKVSSQSPAVSSYELRTTDHGLIVAILLLVLACQCAPAATPFSYQFYNADGSPQTNALTMTAWPPSTNAWTIYGTNIIWGSQTITLTPNTNGYGTNFAYPNSYRVLVSNLNSGFFILLPDTSNQIALGTCLVSAPQVAGPLGFYGLITNWLGFTPATNGLAALTNTLTDTALTGIHGYRPATNTLAAITNMLTDAVLVGIHGYRPATNGLAALTNNLTAGGLLSVLGTIPQASLPQIGYIGVTNLNGAMVTNRATGQIICWTNLPAGITPTIDLPDGSLVIATNGNLYLRSNSTAINLK